MGDLSTSENVFNYLEKDQFAKLIGAELIESGINYSKCQLIIQQQHHNGIGTVHGGLIYALADVTVAVACNSEQATIGMQADIRYMNKVKGTCLIAEANLISRSRKIGHYQVDITDEIGTQVAQVNVTVYHLPAKA